MTTIRITINGRAHGPMDVRDELTMNDFLREYLGLTGTKFGCGAAQCLSCAVIVDEPDGTSRTMPTCIRCPPSVSTARRSARSTASRKTASCPFCKKRSSSISRSSAATAPRVFSTRRRFCSSGSPKRPSRAPILEESTILDALNGHLCRCTGYYKYHEAVRDVILADAKRPISHERPS